MRSFVRTVDAISVACAVAASIMLTLAVLIVTWMVIYRAMGNSAYWEIEASIYLMVGAVFLGSPYCARTNGHVGVDLLTEFTPKSAARAIATVLAIVSLLVCVYLAVVGAQLTFHSWITGETTESYWRPAKWPLYLSMPVGLALTALQYLAEAVRPRTGA
jgi:TRAP-type C4-dicarboxylate transport system permease small subunit